MDFSQCYVILLRKGPTWSPEATPEIEELQQKHLAHLAGMRRSGKLAIAGPVEAHSDSDLRGITIFHFDEFVSIDELKILVEQDPMIKVDRLRAEYFIWYFPQDSSLEKQKL